MFDLPSWRVGRIVGIPIEINASWVLIFVLVAATLSLSYFPLAYPDRPVAVDVASGIITALLFFGSVVLHEAAHSLVARAGGTDIRKITLFVFGGVAQMEEEPSSPGREFVMAAAGPAMSLVIAGLSFALFVGLVFLRAPNIWWAPLEYLAVINVGVAVFNLLPGFPLDGGRILRALIWKLTGDLLKATRGASLVGQGIGWLMVATGVFGAVMGRLNLVWFALLGWFLASMAANAYRDQRARSQLSHITVGSQMSSPAVVVSGDITVRELVDDYFLGGRHSQYPVVLDDQVVGILRMGDVKEVPHEAWDTTRLDDLAHHDVDSLAYAPTAALDSVLGRLGPDDPGALLVVEEGRLVGILTRSDVIRALRHPSSLG